MKSSKKWNQYPLKEIADITSGGTPKRSEKKYWNGDIPWLVISDIPKNGLVSSSKEKISKSGLENSSTKLFPKGTILVSIFASIGKIGLLEIDSCTNQSIVGIQITDKKVKTKFLFYLLKSLSYFLISRGRGGVQKGINQKILKEMLIPIPNESTQLQIIELFDLLSNILATLNIQKTQLENLLNYERERLFSKSNKSTLLSKLVTSPPYRYPTFYGFKFGKTGIPVLKIRDMTKNAKFPVDTSLYDHITEEVHKRFPKTVVDEGDLVVEVRGTYLGKTALVPSELKNSNLSPNTVRVAVDKKKIIPSFFWHYTFTSEWNNQILKIATFWKEKFGTLKTPDLNSLNIPFPTMSDQKKIVGELNLIDKIIEKISQDIEKYELLYAKILNEKFHKHLDF